LVEFVEKHQQNRRPTAWDHDTSPANNSNAYNANAVMPSKDSDDLLNLIDGGEGAYKVNMVFRKKVKFRN
jgi:hypothetical protein